MVFFLSRNKQENHLTPMEGLAFAFVVAGNPQAQTFTYDELDRLTSAKAEGGTYGNYSLQYYTYDASTGNLSSKAGVNYTYGDANHDHAMTSLSSGESYAYDPKGEPGPDRYIEAQVWADEPLELYLGSKR
jgi:hypothetical protein